MPERTGDELAKAAALKWEAYKAKMADLFVFRDKYPLDSPQREAAAQAIVSMWVAEG